MLGREPVQPVALASQVKQPQESAGEWKSYAWGTRVLKRYTGRQKEREDEHKQKKLGTLGCFNLSYS